jgi:hypothetical protein
MMDWLGYSLAFLIGAWLGYVLTILMFIKTDGWIERK